MNPAGQTKPPLFTRVFESRLDDKRRLTIPANWRFDGEAESSYLAIYNPQHAAIVVYPPEMQQRLMEASQRPEIMGEPELYDVILELAGLAEPVTCDKAGRIILPPEMLKAAGIEREVVLQGAFANFLIRSKTPQKPDRDSDRARRLHRGLVALGFAKPVQ